MQSQQSQQLHPGVNDHLIPEVIPKCNRNECHLSYSFISVTKLMRKDMDSEFSLIKALNINWAKKII